MRRVRILYSFVSILIVHKHQVHPFKAFWIILHNEWKQWLCTGTTPTKKRTYAKRSFPIVRVSNVTLLIRVTLLLNYTRPVKTVLQNPNDVLLYNFISLSTYILATLYVWGRCLHFHYFYIINIFFCFTIYH